MFHCKTPFQLGDWRLHCRQDVVKMPIKSPWPVRHVPRNKPVEWKWNVTSYHSYKIHDAGFEWTSSYLKQSWTFWFCAKPKKRRSDKKTLLPQSHSIFWTAALLVLTCPLMTNMVRVKRVNSCRKMSWRDMKRVWVNGSSSHWGFELKRIQLWKYMREFHTKPILAGVSWGLNLQQFEWSRVYCTL